jgi:hypothetical protein
MGRLDGQVAIVTGGSRGIGRAVALEFAREGARIAIAAVKDRSALQKVEGEIVALGRESIGMLANVVRRGEFDRLVQAVLAKWGRIDVLVNNAGVLQLAPLENISEERWDDTLAVHLKGTFNCIQAVIPFMKQHKEGEDHQHRGAVGAARFIRSRRLRGSEGRYHRSYQERGERAQAAQYPGELHLAGGGHALDRGTDKVSPRASRHSAPRARIHCAGSNRTGFFILCNGRFRFRIRPIDRGRARLATASRLYRKVTSHRAKEDGQRCSSTSFSASVMYPKFV